MDLKELTINLIKQEFGDLVLDIQFSGPFEYEDLDVDVVLKEMPENLLKRGARIHRYLRGKGFDVLIGYEPPFDEIDEATIEEQKERQIIETAKLLETMSKAIRLREAEKRTIKINGTVVDGKLVFSTNDSDGRVKVDGNEIITPNERIIVEIN
ncbi:hypothetical protein FJZ31_01680 [Candidatus Poribacteria bacterium]|nr:hypothetical protein [Candidatus Poribacteria bacterium]